MKIFCKKKDGGKELEIKLYGVISKDGDNSAVKLTQIIEEGSEKYERIRFRVHCYGGEVFEGIAIFNAIRSCKATTIAHVVGIAASMASIIVLAADEVYMAKNAFLMIHSPSADAKGNATALREAASVLDKVGITLEEHYTDKNKAIVAEIKELFNGKDHWFRAEEALKKGLIDGITDAISKRNLPTNFQQLKPSAAYDYYLTGFADDEFKPIDKTMNDQFKFKVVALGVTALKGVTVDSSDAEVEAEIFKILNEHDALLIENKSLKDEIKKTKDQQVEAFLNANKDRFKDDAQKDAIRKMAETSGIEAVQNLWNIATPQQVKKRESLTERIQNAGHFGGITPQGGGHQPVMDWNWYQEHSPEALAEMEENDPEQFEALLNAEYHKPNKNQ